MNFFYKNDILFDLELDPNSTHAVIDMLCERLDIATEPQEQRIERHEMLRDGVTLVQVEVENGTANMLALRTDLVPLWLTGINPAMVTPELQSKLELFQREAASLLWQAARPQGYGPEDALVPVRHQQTAAEIAYVSAQGLANLSRQQMLIERQIDADRADRANLRADLSAAEDLDDPQAELLARTVRRVALALAERTRRNEYAGIFSGLFRQFGIASYRRMPPSRLHEALEWLERWHGDILGEPEPPPDI